MSKIINLWRVVGNGVATQWDCEQIWMEGRIIWSLSIKYKLPAIESWVSWILQEKTKKMGAGCCRRKWDRIKEPKARKTIIGMHIIPTIEYEFWFQSHGPNKIMKFDCNRTVQINFGENVRRNSFSFGLYATVFRFSPG